MTDFHPVLRRRLHRNSPNWYIFISGSKDSKSIWLPTKTTDELEALQMLEAVKKEGLAGAAAAIRKDVMTRVYWRRVFRGKNIEVHAAVQEYLAVMLLQGRADKTVQLAASQLDLWVRSAACGHQLISSITQDHIAPFINGPELTHRYSTRGLKLTILRNFFQWCVDGERLPMNPCRNMFVRTQDIPQEKLIERKSVPFSDEEVEKLLSVIEPTDWWRGVVLLGKHFGLRLTAAAEIQWASMPNFERLKIFTHKGRVVVDEPLPGEVAEWFRGWPVEGETGYCFPAAVGLRNHSRSFALICRRAGISGKSFRSLRVRTVTNEINSVLGQLGGEERAVMATLLVKHGVAGVQRLVGHVAGSRVTTGRYFNPQPA